MIEKACSDQTLNDFYEYLSALLGHFTNLIPILKEELSCIISGNIDLLGENLKAQQVLLLQTKNFDSQIARYSEELLIEAKNLTELALQLEAEQQLRFFSLLGQFDTTITEVNYYKEKCRVLLQSKLYVLEKALSMVEMPQDITTYDKNAFEVPRGTFPKSFEKKV